MLKCISCLKIIYIIIIVVILLYSESLSTNTQLTMCFLIISDVTKIQNGIGDKVGMVIQSVSMFLSGFVIGFVYSWKLTLVILSLTPALVVTGGVTGKASTNHMIQSKASSFATSHFFLLIY